VNKERGVVIQQYIMCPKMQPAAASSRLDGTTFSPKDEGSRLFRNDGR